MSDEPGTASGDNESLPHASASQSGSNRGGGSLKNTGLIEEKGNLAMASISEDQPIENGLIADIAGYVPASAVLERGQRQDARLKLRASLRQVSSLKRLRSCGLPFS